MLKVDCSASVKIRQLWLPHQLLKSGILQKLAPFVRPESVQLALSRFFANHQPRTACLTASCMGSPRPELQQWQVLALLTRSALPHMLSPHCESSHLYLGVVVGREKDDSRFRRVLPDTFGSFDSIQMGNSRSSRTMSGRNSAAF